MKVMLFEGEETQRWGRFGPCAVLRATSHDAWWLGVVADVWDPLDRILKPKGLCAAVQYRAAHFVQLGRLSCTFSSGLRAVVCVLLVRGMRIAGKCYVLHVCHTASWCLHMHTFVGWMA